MSDEWRVSLIPGNRTGVPKKMIEDLRVRLGDDVAVSGGKGRIFLYAGTEKAVGEAEYVAREVLTLEGLTAESLLECWDPAVQKWRDPRVEVPGDEDDRKAGRLRSAAGAVIDGVTQVIGDSPY